VNKEKPKAVLNTNICWSKFAFTPEGKLLINVLASAIQDIIKPGVDMQSKRAAMKWLFYEDSPMKQTCLLLLDMHDDMLEKLLIDHIGEDKFDALIKASRGELIKKTRGRKKIEGVERTKSGRIKRRSKNGRTVGRPSKNLLDNKSRT
jgi:hypothetical protein